MHIPRISTDACLYQTARYRWRTACPPAGALESAPLGVRSETCAVKGLYIVGSVRRSDGGGLKPRRHAFTGCPGMDLGAEAGLLATPARTANRAASHDGARICRRRRVFHPLVSTAAVGTAGASSRYFLRRLALASTRITWNGPEVFGSTLAAAFTAPSASVPKCTIAAIAISCPDPIAHGPSTSVNVQPM